MNTATDEINALTMRSLTERLRNSVATYQYRITWIANVPHLQVLVTRFTMCGPRAGSWETLRPATAADMAAMYTGIVGVDGNTEIGLLGWKNHVRAGGD